MPDPAHAMTEPGPDAEQVAARLDALPGGWEAAQEGLEQAPRGEGVALDEWA